MNLRTGMLPEHATSAFYQGANSKVNSYVSDSVDVGGGLGESFFKKAMSTTKILPTVGSREDALAKYNRTLKAEDHPDIGVSSYQFIPKQTAADYKGDAMANWVNEQPAASTPKEKEEKEETPQDLRGYADVANAAVGAFSAFQDYKTAKLQRRGLRQNIAQQKVDNDFRAEARKNINTPMISNNNTGMVT